MNESTLRVLLEQVASGQAKPEDALESLRTLPYAEGIERFAKECLKWFLRATKLHCKRVMP